LLKKLRKCLKPTNKKVDYSITQVRFTPAGLYLKIVLSVRLLGLIQKLIVADAVLSPNEGFKVKVGIFTY